MLTVKTHAFTEKGALRPQVRTTIKDAISELQLVLSNGSIVTLDYMGNGEYYGQVAVCEDGAAVYGKVSLAITTNDYKAPAKKKAPVKEHEVIEIE